MILDTNILIEHFRTARRRDETRGRVADPVKWARELILRQNSCFILSPIALEFLGGVVDRSEMDQSLTFLSQFNVLDAGDIRPEDWTKAIGLAKRISRGPRPQRRGAIDCLIRAVASRFRYEVYSNDKAFPG